MRRFHTPVLVLLLYLCGTVTGVAQQRDTEFTRQFERGDLKKALKALENNRSRGERRNKFLFYSNYGLTLSILGRYEESNEYFEKAFLFGEDFHVNYVYEAASYLTNPLITPYRGEDHEHLMVLYYKAINYLKMKEPEKALIECRRLDIRLKKLSDKYADESRFQRDAFVHTLMGIIYQSTSDFNNAFIAYRNALEIYEREYDSLFAVSVPMQLRKDLLNTAWWTGFTEEFAFYQQKFGMTDYVVKAPEAELVFFWHNGLAPVKAEWSINFMIHREGPDMVVFKNDEHHLAFPFELKEDRKDRDRKLDLADLEFFRVAFPKYVERPAYYQSASLEVDSVTYALERAEDVAQIAVYSLQQRMHLEFAKGLLRAALKKASEHSMRKENENFGALIGLVNAITERADTRSWQTLPQSISYARVPLTAGDNRVTFTLRDYNGQPAEYKFTYNAEKGQTLFHTFSSLETTNGYPRMSGLTD